MDEREFNDFQRDCMELMAEQRARGLSRRDVLRTALAAGVPLALAPLGVARAFAQEVSGKEIVLCNWGGVAEKAFTEGFVKPYEAAGGKMVLDGSGPSSGKLLNMVQSHNVTWDIADSGLAGLSQLVPQGALEPIDYSIVDKSKVIADFAYEYGVVNYLFSSVMAWDSEKIDGTPTLADFFDLEKYPGRRMIRKDAQGMLELALLADGVAIEDLYPLDTDRAFAKYKAILPELLFWSSGSESQSLLRDGEAVMGLLWNTRANVLTQETGGRIKYTFKGGLLQPGLWVVPKGNPAGAEAAMQAIAFMQAPEGQVKVLEMLGNGPANPAASALVPDDIKPSNPGDPANVAVQAKVDAGWYDKHYGDTLQAFLDLISS